MATKQLTELEQIKAGLKQLLEGFLRVKEEHEVLASRIENRIEVLEEKEKAWGLREEAVRSRIASAENKIVLDIGGKRFTTTKSTLVSHKGSIFDDMISSGHWKPEADGSYFIDRNGKLFGVILEYLRTGQVNLSKSHYDLANALKVEFQYYKIATPELTQDSVPAVPTPAKAVESQVFTGTNMLNSQQCDKLAEWLGKKPTALLYSATRDGFEAQQFHDKCDNKGPTLVVVKSSQGYLFGGYAAQPWNSNYGYLNAPGPFIFTLTNPHMIPPTKYSIKSSDSGNHMYGSPDCGPAFGGGHDICISNQSNANTSSYTNFPYTYQDTTEKGNNTFTGQKNFQTADIEVFSVQ